MLVPCLVLVFVVLPAQVTCTAADKYLGTNDVEYICPQYCRCGPGMWKPGSQIHATCSEELINSDAQKPAILPPQTVSLTINCTSHHRIAISADAFTYLTKLQELELSNCSLSELPAGLLSQQTKLTHFVVTTQGELHIPYGLFRSNVLLEKLKINAKRGLQDFRFDDLSTLKHLNRLDLSGNLLKRVAGKQSHSYLPALAVYDLSNNSITELNIVFAEDCCPQLERLDLSLNSLSYISSKVFQGLYQLIILKLDYNMLTTLTLADSGVVELWAEHNNLTHLNLSSTISLQLLDVRYNKLTTDVIDDLDQPNIKALFANYNHLADIPKRFLLQAFFLDNLDLSGNNLSCLPANVFQNNKYLIELYLNDCGLVEVDIGAFNGLALLHILEMSNNKLTNLHGLFANSSKPRQQLSSDNQLTTLTPGTWPDLIIDVDLGYNQLTELLNTSFDRLRNLYEFYLNNNLISYIANGIFQHLTDIYFIDLRNNMLTEIDLFGLFDNWYFDGTLWLENNPWRCTCLDEYLKGEFLDFSDRIDYISFVMCNETDPRLYPDYIPVGESLPIIEADFTKCQNETIPKTIVNQLTHETWSGLISGGVLFILTLTVMLLLIKFRRFLQIWLYAKFGFRFNWKSTDNVYKQWDVYVAFDDNNTDFVLNELMPRLERELSFKLCIRLRDWLVGDSISDTILESIHNSHRTILLLSDHFQNNEWSDYEFQVAHHRHLQDKVHNHLIVFLIQDKAPEIVNKTLKMYISTGSYIKLSDPWCWQKLAFTLPSVSEEVAERRRKEPTAIEQALCVQRIEMERLGYRFHEGSVVEV